MAEGRWGDVPDGMSNEEAGSILAHDIYTTDGRSYLPAGSEVTVRITTLLRDLCELGNISSELRIVG